jgi:serine/threonine protein kinase
MMEPDRPLPQLPSEKRSTVERLLKDFEHAWQSGQRPALAEYLSDSQVKSPVALAELVRLDLEYRLRAGERARVESYLADYPELAGEAATVLDLLTQEYRLRRPREPALAPDEYVARFPEYRDAILSRLRDPAPPPPAADQATGSLATAAAWGHSGTADSTSHGPIGAVDERPPTSAVYEVLSAVGRGGMGIVYRAHDRQRGTVVALKTLPRLDPASLYRFKQEFRACAHVVHPNLVTLYELVAEGRQWFFAMEFVDGVDFLTYVRGEGKARGALPADGLVGLRDSLRQLAAGLEALHRAGKLHRDVKPSNILVTPTGRVVLLDFGLVAELDAARKHGAVEDTVVGTAAYMAPEQAAGLPLSAASDWYSVGVLLYQALTGHLPFKGSAAEVVSAKQQGDPPPPSSGCPGVPEDLDALCMALLSRGPTLRPSGAEVVRRLGGVEAGRAAGHPVAESSTGADIFVGRTPHLQALRDAFRSLHDEQGVTIYVRGSSGVGKSALVQRFLDEATGHGAVVLAGRCYEHESVPYKALDSLVDALSRYLRRIPEAEAAALVPHDVRPLARIFPVLRGVEAIARASRASNETPDPHELRRRAFTALRALVARLGQRCPLVLAIDDLQWGDADSAALVDELLRPPDAPLLLLVGSYRREDESTSPFLRNLLDLAKKTGTSPSRRMLDVEPLTPDETRELAVRLLGRDDASAHALADAVVRESGGNPFLAAEMVRHLQTSAAPLAPGAATPAVSLDRVLWERISRLPEEARRLLEVAAVHGRPLRQSDASAATGLHADERPALAVLRSGRLLRSTGATERDEVETYHDRVRETVAAHLEPAVRARIHGSLARTLEASGRAEPEVLAVHYHGAGEGGRAGRYYGVAAAQAAEALAFERAAKLYRLALDLGGGDRKEERRLRTELGHALANAGRGAEAAQAYLAAAREADPAEALDLRRRAAQQFLLSGRVDEGLPILRDVLHAVGLRLARTPRRAFWSLLFYRAVLELRGLRFRERSADQVPAAELARIDIGWAAALGLSMNDNIRAADIQTRHLLLALRAGEPSRIARALALEVPHTAAHTGQRMKRRAAHLAALSERLARRLDDPYLIGLRGICQGVGEYVNERWQRALERVDGGDQLIRDRCTGVAFERATSHTFALWSLLQLGELAEFARRCPALMREARARGDLYAVTNLLSFTPFERLMADDPAGARRDIAEALAQWSHEGYHIQHYALLQAQVAVELYTGNGRAAWEQVGAQWPAFAGSFLKRVQLFRIQLRQLQAFSALAAAAMPGASPAPLLGSALGFARRLGREGTRWSTATALYIRGAAAVARGDAGSARRLLGEALTRFEAAAMRLHVAGVRRRLGEVIGGGEGQALIASADAWMAAQNIRDPARFTALFAPGFPLGTGRP